MAITPSWSGEISYRNVFCNASRRGVEVLLWDGDCGTPRPGDHSGITPFVGVIEETYSTVLQEAIAQTRRTIHRLFISSCTGLGVRTLCYKALSLLLD